MSDIANTVLVAGTTFTQTSTDTAAALTASSLISASGNRAAGILMSAQTKTVRYAFTATPVAGVGGLGHDLGDGEEVYIEGAGSIKKIQVISQTAGQHGVLTITPFFESGR